MDTVTAPAPVALSIQVSLKIAKSIASLSNFASKDKITPALTVVKIEFSEGMIKALATDRYVAVRAKYDYDYDAYGVIYLDAQAVKFITGLKNSPFVQFELSDGVLSIGDGSASVSSAIFKGNYPDIESIMDKHQPATVASIQRFRIELLAKLGKVISKIDGKKVENWVLEQGLSERPDRPAPMKATAENFDAIIQPNLLAR